jgi:rhodanese-related sulfurtransferase/rubrerythrin
MGFKQLFYSPPALNTEEARAFMASRASTEYLLLDVRQPGEYADSHIPGSVLIPLPQLADRLAELPQATPTIVYCAIGGRSSMAARFLAGRGFKEVYNLSGGIEAWRGETVASPVDKHLPYLEACATPERLALLACQMEAGLEAFYERLAEAASDSQVEKLLRKLARLEDQHERHIVELAERLGIEVTPLEGEADSDTVEGGLDMEAFLMENEALLRTTRGVLEVAIMVEAHALDLYLRFATTVNDDASKRMLHAIADEERKHLGLLAQQLEFASA